MKRTTGSSRRTRRILVIHSEGNSFNNPSLKCLIDLLIGKGYELDLRYARSRVPMPTYPGVRLLPFGTTVCRLKTVIFDRLGWRWLATLSIRLERLVRYRRYDLLVGVDRLGIIQAGLLHDLTGTPFVLFSFEIMFESETSPRFKKLERRASGSLSMWIVQDAERAQQLEIENGLEHNNRFLLPLASAGTGVSSAARLRDNLHLPDRMKAAIVIGSVAGWALTGRIMQSVERWPEDWALIVHERYGNVRQSLATEGLDRVAHLLGHRIFLSDDAPPLVDDLGTVLAGISVGLAFYEPDFLGPYTGKNLVHLGLAAGKISTYLRYGLPVVVNEIGRYAREVREYGFGEVVEGPEQIAEILSRIVSDEYRRNASDYFSQKLDFEVYSSDLWARLSESMNPGAPRARAI